MSIKKQYIPAPLASAVKNGYVTDTSEILDETKNKRQNVINQETDNEISGIKGGSTKSIAELSEDIANEAERASGVEAGLRESIDELGQIGLDPDNAISTDGDDFDGDTTAKRSKIPTIGAIIDGNPSVYDVSKRNPTGGPNSDGKFTLEYILANANTLIPTSRRYGGMEICFVHTSDNKYIRYNLLADSFTTDTTQWAIDDAGVYVDNPEFIAVKLDGEGRILIAIEKDGNVKYGAGVPRQIKEYIDSKIDELDGDIDSINDFLSGFDTTTLKEYLNTTYGNYIDNPEFLEAATDGNGMVTEGTKKDGTKVFPAGIETSQVKTRKATIEEIELGNNAKEYIKDFIPTIEDGNILALHPRTIMASVLSQYKHSADWANVSGEDPADFVLLWFSDLHSQWRRLGRIMEFYDAYKEYIDDAVSCGDQNHAFTYDYSNWGSNNAGPVLAIMGNHDVQSNEDRYVNGVPLVKWGDNTQYSQKECYDKYIKPYLNDMDIVIGENHTYFYKDYPTYKIRIIGTDDFHCNERVQLNTTPRTYSDIYPDGEPVDTGQQLTWFENTLESARQNDYSVICLNHCQVPFNRVDCPFDSLYNRDDLFQHTVFSEKVHQFVQNGGKFITWLVGDCHLDAFGTLKTYPEQLMISIDTAGSRLQNSGGYERIENTLCDDLFNMVSVNTQKGIITLKRIGANYDKFGRKVDSMSYDYINKQIIQIN